MHTGDWKLIENISDLVRDELGEMRKDIRAQTDVIVDMSERLGSIDERVTIMNQNCQDRKIKCSAEFQKIGASVVDTHDYIIGEKGAARKVTAIWKTSMAIVGLIIAMASAIGISRWIEIKLPAATATTSHKDIRP
jgi:hypothetical protein